MRSKYPLLLQLTFGFTRITMLEEQFNKVDAFSQGSDRYIWRLHCSRGNIVSACAQLLNSSLFIGLPLAFTLGFFRKTDQGTMNMFFHLISFGLTFDIRRLTFDLRSLTRLAMYRCCYFEYMNIVWYCSVGDVTSTRDGIFTVHRPSSASRTLWKSITWATININFQISWGSTIFKLHWSQHVAIIIAPLNSDAMTV